MRMCRENSMSSVSLSLTDIIRCGLTMGQPRSEKSALSSKRGDVIWRKEHLMRRQEIWVLVPNLQS